MFRRAWTRYCQLLVEKPLPTKAATGGTLFALGDLIGQKIDGTLDSPSGYDPKRSLKGFVWSAFLYTPVAHVWYNRFLEKSIPKTDFPAVCSKVALDQLLFAPVVNVGFLTYYNTVNGASLEETKTNVKEKTWDILKANWMLWPAVQLINFKLIPPYLQIPVLNVTVMLWSAYLAIAAKSHKNNDGNNNNNSNNNSDNNNNNNSGNINTDVVTVSKSNI